VKLLNQFGLILTDTVAIHNSTNEVLTKQSKEISDVSYIINSNSDEDVLTEVVTDVVTTNKQQPSIE